MFERSILKQLSSWAEKSQRKPLIIRGARQVGKTTAVNMFSKLSDNYIYLNLELSEEKRLFEQGYSVEELVSAIFFFKDLLNVGPKIFKVCSA